MRSLRPADTFVVRIRREPAEGHGTPIERWQVEHVQTGLQVYVHGLEEAVSVLRSCLAPDHEPHVRRVRRS